MERPSHAISSMLKSFIHTASRGIRRYRPRCSAVKQKSARGASARNPARQRFN